MIKRALVVSCFAAIVVACGSSGDSQFGNGSGDDGGAGDDGSIDPNGGDGGMMFNNTDGDLQTDTGLNACATDSQRAKLLPLDLYIMQDTTGSMNSLVAAGQSKFQAVRSSLISFVNDPGSAGIGVGLQYFPLKVAGVPETCTATSQCGVAGGQCLLKACFGDVRPGLIGCTTNGDCLGTTCQSSGVCANNHSYFCPVGAGNCGNDPGGFPLGNCTAALTTSFCVDGDSCSGPQYAAPGVAIALLPAAAPALVASLNARTVYGNTPTIAALQGAVDGAKAAAIANPTHTVVAVFATDGLPSECDTNIANIKAVAAAALAGTPSIKTFVIGVFTTAEQPTAKPNLDQIAAAGGTTNAFVVTASGGASAAFLTALNTIRGTALPCQYTLPVPEAGTPDYTKLNVQYTAGSGAASIIGYATSAAGCDPLTGGWYFDADPAMGGHPTKVIMCPATCAKLKADTTGKIDIVQGCTTQVVVK